MGKMAWCNYWLNLFFNLSLKVPSFERNFGGHSGKGEKVSDRLFKAPVYSCQSAPDKEGLKRTFERSHLNLLFLKWEIPVWWRIKELCKVSGEAESTTLKCRVPLWLHRQRIFTLITKYFFQSLKILILICLQTK